MKIGRLAELALLWLLLAACTSLRPDVYRTFAVAADPQPDLVYRGVPLRSGQIIVSDEGARVGFFIGLIAERFEPWVHAGVISIEDGEPWVYEALGKVALHWSGPPTDATTGRIHRTRFASYVARQRIAAVYEPPLGVDLVAVARFARESWQTKTPFDPYFDDRDHARLYCTEFVAAAMEHGGAAPIAPVPIRDNRSIGVVLDWLKIPGPTIVLAGSLVSSSRRVALLSRPYSESEVAAFFEVKRELHRRFTSDQRLGFVFAGSITGVALRPEVEAFITNGVAQGRARSRSSSDEIAREVRELADRTFGPVRKPTDVARTAPRPW